MKQIIVTMYDGSTHTVEVTGDAEEALDRITSRSDEFADGWLISTLGEHLNVTYAMRLERKHNATTIITPPGQNTDAEQRTLSPIGGTGLYGKEHSAVTGDYVESTQKSPSVVVLPSGDFYVYHVDYQINKPVSLESASGKAVLRFLRCQHLAPNVSVWGGVASYFSPAVQRTLETLKGNH